MKERLNEVFKALNNTESGLSISSLLTFNFIEIKVFDSRGKLLHIVLNKLKKSGNHSVDFTAKNLSSRIYYYRFESGSFTQVRKMILLK